MITEEQKKLLIKDLSARVPYDTWVLMETEGSDEGWKTSVQHDYCLGYISGKITRLYFHEITFKPYLRPMESMTKEEKEELLISILGNKEDTKYFQVMSDGSIDNTDKASQKSINFTFHWINFDGINTSSYIDWLNAHHFDYRGLIPKGLAIKAPEEMYNF